MLDKRGDDERGTTRQGSHQESERHSQQRHHQTFVVSPRHTVAVPHRASSRSTGTWTTRCFRILATAPCNGGSAEELFSGTWTRRGELVSKSAGSEEMANDEGVEKQDDEERDEGVERGVDPRPDVRNQSLVKFRASTVGDIGAGNLTGNIDSRQRRSHVLKNTIGQLHGRRKRTVCRGSDTPNYLCGDIDMYIPLENPNT